MKRLLSTILIMALCLTLFSINASAALKPINPNNERSISTEENTKGVSISQSTATIYKGKSIKLKVNGTSEYTQWKSDNINVATVSKSGIVIGVESGTANITAIIGYGDDRIQLTCQVTIQSRISASVKNIVCEKDEYREVNVQCNNLKKYEALYYDVDNTEVADTKVITDGTIRVLPKKDGYMTINVYVGEDGKITDYNDVLKIHVFVVDDKDWIPEGYLEKYYLVDSDDLFLADYDYDTHTLEYHGQELSFKWENGFPVYLYVEDLKEAGIL